MKIRKRTILFIFLFVIILFLLYLIASSFFFNTLTFKTFYQFNRMSENENDFNIQYVLNDKNEIIYVYKDKEDVKINKILDNDVSPKTLFTFSLKEEEEIQSFCQAGTYYYLFYQQNQSLIQMDLENKVYQDYKNLPQGKLIINPFNDQLFLYDSNQLFSLHYANENYSLDLIYRFSLENVDIKNIEFLKQNQFIMTTYEGFIYSVNLITNETIKLNRFYQEYVIENEKLYATFYKDHKTLGILIYDGLEEETFEINTVDYLKMVVKNDYLYLINNLEMNKVSLVRKKKQEKMIISKYQDMNYNLTNVMIVNEKLMYLPMMKTNWNYDTQKNEYEYYLYRYKIK